MIANEGTLNLSVFCEVYSQGNQIQTRWVIQRQSDGTVLEIMFTNGDVTGPADLVDKVTVTGELTPNTMITYGTNFT